MRTESGPGRLEVLDPSSTFSYLAPLWLMRCLNAGSACILAANALLAAVVFPALVWLEQTKPGVFVKHTIDTVFPRHATLDVADIDGDGDIDIVTGYFSINKPAESWVQVWINQSKPLRRSG